MTLDRVTFYNLPHERKNTREVLEQSIRRSHLTSAGSGKERSLRQGTATCRGEEPTPKPIGLPSPCRMGGIALHTGFRQVDRAKKYRRFVLHKCDNRKCCNPNHLFLGSMSTNQKDAYAKGRKVQPRSKHVNAKLSPEQVRAIRYRYAQGEAVQVDSAAGVWGKPTGDQPDRSQRNI